MKNDRRYVAFLAGMAFMAVVGLIAYFVLPWLSSALRPQRTAEQRQRDQRIEYLLSTVKTKDRELGEKPQNYGPPNIGDQTQRKIQDAVKAVEIQKMLKEVDQLQVANGDKMITTEAIIELIAARGWTVIERRNENRAARGVLFTSQPINDSTDREAERYRAACRLAAHVGIDPSSAANERKSDRT